MLQKTFQSISDDQPKCVGHLKHHIPKLNPPASKSGPLYTRSGHQNASKEPF